MKARSDSAAISRLSEEVARCPENDAVCYIVEPSTSGRVALYKELSDHLENMNVYCVLDLLEFAPYDRFSRRH